MVPVPDMDERVAQSMAFGHLEIAFDDRVLRPRPWTAAQSRWAASLLPQTPGSGFVLELCTGAGHIGLLAMAHPRAAGQRLIAVDVNPVACRFVRLNTEAAGLVDRVEVREGRIEDVLAPGERFDLVIADPPWVPSEETGRHPDDPRIAIDGGDDGLDVAWSSIRASETHLVTGGSVVLQLGSLVQVDLVRERLLTAGSPLSVHEVRAFGDRGVLVRLAASAA